MDWVELFQNVLDEMVRTGDEFADAKSQSWLLQEQRSAVLSRVMNEIAEEEPKLAVSKVEAKARASNEYQEHLVGTSEAIRAELKAKCRYERACSEFESLRSRISLDKKTSGYSTTGG